VCPKTWTLLQGHSPEGAGQTLMKFRCPAEFPERHGVLSARTRPACRSAAPRFAISQRHHFQLKTAAPLMDFPASSGLLRPHTCLSSTRARNQGSPHGLFCTLQRPNSVRPSRWGCQDPPEPTHSVSTLSAGRPSGRVQSLSGLFRPDHAHELCTGPCSSRNSPEGASVWKRQLPSMFPCSDSIPEPAFPFEVFLPATTGNGFPRPSSFALSLMSQITVRNEDGTLEYR
jgi:hypothetical protein